MTEYLTIHRDWGVDNVQTKWFTLTFLLGLQKVMDLDDVEDGFVEFITGLNCDSYADLGCDIMKDMWDECSQYDDENKLEGCYDRCMREVEFQTCYTVYRLWNPHHTRDEALESWKESCICTLEGILED